MSTCSLVSILLKRTNLAQVGWLSAAPGKFACARPEVAKTSAAWSRLRRKKVKDMIRGATTIVLLVAACECYAQGYRPPNERAQDIAFLKFLCESKEDLDYRACAGFILGVIQGLNRDPAFDCLDENKDNQGAMKDAVIAALKAQVIISPMQRTPASEFVAAVLTPQFPCLLRRRQPIIPAN